MTNANDQQESQYGEPTEVATALHGDMARAEEHPQPEAVALDPSTRIARPGEDDETDPPAGASAGRTSQR